MLARASVAAVVVSGFLAGCAPSSESSKSDGPGVAAGAGAGAAAGALYLAGSCLPTGPLAPLCVVVMAPVGAVMGGVGGGAARATGGVSPRSARASTEALERHQRSAIDLREGVTARAEAGNAEDMEHLAAMYEHSFTVRNPSDTGPYWITIIPQDYVQAYKWRSLASICGSSDQMPRRDRLANKMSPEQIAEAERLIAEWRSEGKDCAVRADSGAPGVVAGATERGISSAAHGNRDMLKRQLNLAIEHREQITQKAEAGDAEAMAILATMYERGFVAGNPSEPGRSWVTIISKDYVQAYKWRTLANFCGSTNQIPLRIKLSARMSSGQIAEAEQLVSEWQAEGNACAADANDVVGAAN